MNILSIDQKLLKIKKYTFNKKRKVLYRFNKLSRNIEND